MRKLLTPTDWLLIGLSKLSDAYGDMKNVYTPQYKRHNLSQLLYRNLKTNNIRKIVKDGKAYFEMTNQGKKKICRKYPLLYLQNSPWDKKWRIVIYDIEEKTKSVRDSLRRKLKQLGFAKLQESVWISPHDFLQDIHEFLETNSLLDSVLLIESENIYIEDIKILVNKLWHLDGINNLYKQIYEAVHNHEETRGRVEKSDNIREQLIETMLVDPFLPQEFLPEKWYGDMARNAFI